MDKKENIMNDFEKMIKNSWTYNKMTKKEKENWNKTLWSNCTYNSIKGNYNQRWQVLQAIYNSFLLALNYNVLSWRQTNEEKENCPKF